LHSREIVVGLVQIDERLGPAAEHLVPAGWRLVGRKRRSSLVKIKAWGNPPRVNDSTRFGIVTARFSATMVPSEYPRHGPLRVKDSDDV
jgi:hypothetical protein